jgi:hypothetical protein
MSSRPSGSDSESPWVRPTSPRAPALWGHRIGLRVGLHPLPGPRGLLRVYAPYVMESESALINFIAVEPIPVGQTERGYSELEHSALDDAPGKRMWSTAAPDDATPRDPGHPDPGLIETIDGVERLTIEIGVERFENGAHTAVTIRFREDRPHQMELSATARADSVPLSALILTATMGNFARLRRLELDGRDVTPRELWPDFDGRHFAEHARFPLAELRRDGGAAIVSAVSDEVAPATAVYAEGTADGWRYFGRPARQSWRVDDPLPALEVLVNARRVYWASEAPIPGGDAFENMEIVQPYRPGARCTFAVEPIDEPPAAS